MIFFKESIMREASFDSVVCIAAEQRVGWEPHTFSVGAALRRKKSFAEAALIPHVPVVVSYT